MSNKAGSINNTRSKWQATRGRVYTSIIPNRSSCKLLLTNNKLGMNVKYPQTNLKYGQSGPNLMMSVETRRDDNQQTEKRITEERE